MKRVINALIVLAVLALIGAGVAWWSLRDDGVEPDRAGVPTQDDPVSLISSAGVEKNIGRRLTERAGREVEVVCPPKVDELVGTMFRCEASFADDPQVTTIATVKITGGGGAFEWTSEAAPAS